MNKKPRMMISLEPETYAVLTELASELNLSNSALVNQVLGDSVPYMLELVNALKSAKVQSKGSIKTLLEIAHDAYSDVFHSCLDTAKESTEKPEEVKSGRKRQRKIRKPI